MVMPIILVFFYKNIIFINKKVVNDSDESSFNFLGRQVSKDNSIINIEYLNMGNTKVIGQTKKMTEEKKNLKKKL